MTITSDQTSPQPGVDEAGNPQPVIHADDRGRLSTIRPNVARELPEVRQRPTPALMTIFVLANCVVASTAFAKGNIIKVPTNQGLEMIERKLAEEVPAEIAANPDALEELTRPATAESLAKLPADKFKEYLDGMDVPDGTRQHILGLPKAEAIDAALQLRPAEKVNAGNPAPAPPPPLKDIKIKSVESSEDAKKKLDKDKADRAEQLAKDEKKK